MACDSRVLVVDDDAAFAGLVSEALKERGFAPVVCSGPEDAIEQASAGGVGVAVVDLLMPGLSGLDLSDRIHAVSPDTQIVILTGHGDVDTAIEGIQRGVFDFLQKGKINLQRLERAVEGALDKWNLLTRYRETLDHLNDSNRRLSILHDLSTAVSEEMHLDRLLDKVVSSAKGVTAATLGQALLVEPTAGGGYVIERAVGDIAPQVFPGARLAQGEGMTGLALDTGNVVTTLRPQDHPSYSPRCDDLRAAEPGFLCAPLRHRSVRGSLSVAGRPGGFGPADVQVLASLARTVAVALENALAQERAANFATHVSELLVSILEGVDVLNPGHSRHVAALADMVTRRQGLPDWERRNVHFAALLHDIGKIRLDSWMLRSPGKPTPEDRKQLEIHPLIAVEILKPITTWVDILPIIHAHHERWDGAGYPRGLAGEDIPLGARVVAIADAFDAMTRSAAYGPVKSPETALSEIEAGAGTQFDPRLVRLFVMEYREHREELPS